MPDGRVAKVEVPEGTTPEQVMAYVQEQVAKADGAEQPEGGLLRSAGLAARAGIEGAGELVGVFSNPLAYAQEKITGEPVMTGGQLGAYASDKLGLPSPETFSEMTSSEAIKWMTPVGATARGASAVAKGGSKIAETLARAPGSQLAGAATGGVASEYAKQSGGGGAAQFSAGLAGGFTGAAAPSIAKSIHNGLSSIVTSLRGTQADIKQINAALNEMLTANGIKVGDIGGSVRAELIREMKTAINTGGEVNPAVVRRLADHGLVGTTPTRGTTTLDPVQITQEKNLAKIGATSQDENLQSLSRTQRANDMRLTENLNEMGASTQRGAYPTGVAIKESLKGIDAPRKEAVDAAYKMVRDSQGRYANIDVPAFSTMANNALDEKMLGSSLPESARSLLNKVSSGETPLNVNTMAQLDSTLSGLARDAGYGSQPALAIQQVRNALWEAPIESIAGQRAVQLYHRARTMARERFKLIEGNPAMEAALNDIAPDKFVQKFIIGSGEKANVRDVRALVKDLRTVPETFQAARENILYYMKQKALSMAEDELGNFSPAAYRRAIESIGKEKLALVFSKSERKRLYAVGRVAGYEKFQPSGSAVNNSNTTAALAGFTERIVKSSAIAKIPVLRLFASVIDDQMQSATHKLGAKEALKPSILVPQQIERQIPSPAPLALPLIMGQE